MGPFRACSCTSGATGTCIGRTRRLVPHRNRRQRSGHPSSVAIQLVHALRLGVGRLHRLRREGPRRTGSSGLHHSVRSTGRGGTRAAPVHPPGRASLGCTAALRCAVGSAGRGWLLGWEGGASSTGPHLVKQEAGGGEAGDGEEAQDGGVQRGVRLDDVKHGVLVDILEDGADLGER